MRRQVKIMHIDSDYQPHYIIIQEGSFIHSEASLEAAISLLNSEEFDLILSEPQNIAILTKGGEKTGILNRNSERIPRQWPAFCGREYSKGELGYLPTRRTATLIP